MNSGVQDVVNSWSCIRGQKYGCQVRNRLLEKLHLLTIVSETNQKIPFSPSLHYIKMIESYGVLGLGAHY